MSPFSQAMHPKYYVRRTSKGFPITGNWDGDPWKGIPPIELKSYMGSRPEHFPKTQVKLLWDNRFIYVIFRVEDRFVKAIARRYQDSVFQDSCVEFFFTPSSDISYGYFNLEVNCGGTMLFNFQKAPSVERKPISESYARKIELFHSLPTIVDPEISEPINWILEYRIPIEILTHYCEVVWPAPTVRWRANFYKCADRTSHPHWLTWAPVLYPRPNFHLPEFFGYLEFAEEI